MYETHDYILYREKDLRYQPAEVAGIAQYFPQVAVKIGNDEFAGFDQVNPADLDKPDLLHNIYLGLYKDMMEWLEGFLKKHKRQQAFDDAWKQIAPYPGLSVPKKAYCEGTQWQGNEMCNLARWISAVLVSALRNLDSSQYHDFKRALKCVTPLVDFYLIGRYRSHKPDTLVYIERYLQTFQGTKDMFLEFRTSKATRAEPNCQNRDLRELMANQYANRASHNTAAKCCRQVD